MTFNVLTERWIPAQRLDGGGLRDYGLLELLEQAHELLEVVDPAPPIQGGLYRFLIAFVMDALQLQTLGDVVTLLQAERFDSAGLAAYVGHVGRERFDLLHAQQPFLQSQPSEQDADKEKSVAELFFHLPTGTNVIHFCHTSASDHAMAPAVCARALTAIAPFMTAGGAGYSPSINGTPPWYVLLRGNNLFETLVLNCYVQTDRGEDEEPPAWRSGSRVVPGQEVACTSLLQGLTWRPRQVRLLPTDGGVCTYSGQTSPVLVRRMVFGPGFKAGDGAGWTDPYVAYSISDKGRFPLRPREDRELWRDTGPLLLLRQADYTSENGRLQFTRPLVVEQFRRLKQMHKLSRTKSERVEVYGMRADKAKVFEWHFERLSLQAGVTDNPQAGPQVQQALELADGVAYALRRALKEAYPREGDGNEKAFERIIQATQVDFWSTLRADHFDKHFLPALAEQDPVDLDARLALGVQWKARLKAVGGNALENALGPLDTGAKALERQVAARATLARMLASLLNPAPAGSARPKGRRKTS